MQGRMKEHLLNATEIDSLLAKAKVGHIGTHNADGYPYVLPVHFAYTNGYIYIHGLCEGQKIDNINANPKIGFEVAEMEGFILDDKACDVNTKYQSVVILGQAQLVTDTDEKILALNNVVGKYTPHLARQEYPAAMLKATGIIKITIETITGKYYR